jgi:hypothetical protein
MLMVKQELISRSPLRILEQSTHGGVGRGNIGVIAAPKGVGKTACLVHLATDRLFQDKHIIHVSFADSTDHIIAWYEDIFQEIAQRYNLDNAMDVHDALVRNRIIMNFIQNGVHIGQIEKSVRSLIANTAFNADAIIIDGYDFSRSSIAELCEVKNFAGELGLEVWFSATVQKLLPSAGPQRIPDELMHLFEELEVVIYLEPHEGFVHLTLLKDHNVDLMTDPHLKLDPRILLIAEE